MNGNGQNNKITRRGFFFLLLEIALSLGVMGAVFGYIIKALMPSNWGPQLYVKRKIYAAPLSALNAPGNTIMFKDEINRRKAILINNNGNIQAFSLICTHLGCQVQWDDANKKFLCPCHNAVFFADGTVQSGPPPRPLNQYAVIINGNMVFIEFQEPYWQPNQYFTKS